MWAGRMFATAKFLCFWQVFNNHGIQIQQCMGPSMMPTFNIKGDILLLEHFSVDFKRIKVGDVVMCRSPINPQIVICKRVLGMEGDIVQVNSSKTLKVPQGHVWLQGDNPPRSRDSRDYGPVPYALLKGRVIFRVWPPKGWGRVSSFNPAIYSI